MDDAKWLTSIINDRNSPDESKKGLIKIMQNPSYNPMLEASFLGDLDRVKKILPTFSHDKEMLLQLLIIQDNRGNTPLNLSVMDGHKAIEDMISSVTGNNERVIWQKT